MAALPSDVSEGKAPRRRNRQDSEDTARRNWERYEYVRERGHVDYTHQAAQLVDMYVGGGRQWTDEDKAYLEDQGRPVIEINEIKDSINAMVGYQLANRMDIAFLPVADGAEQEIAETLNKVAKQVAHNNSLHTLETTVFFDGLVRRRGYFDIRLGFTDSLYGEIKVTTLDPADVIPDPDAKNYDPDSWSDVIVTRWLTLDEIEDEYGARARKAVEDDVGRFGDSDFGQDDWEAARSKFSEDSDLDYNPTYDASWLDGGVLRVRVIERQYWERELTRVVVSPNGDVRLAEHATEDQIQQYRRDGWVVWRRKQKRVRWTVSTSTVTLFDDVSPFPWFTVVPYFPYFTRGITRGAVDDMVGPQQLLNKAVSQFLHIVNSTANSGWVVEQNSLTNMDTDDLEGEGAATGLVLEYAKGAEKPEKISHNQAPSGIQNLIELGSIKIRRVVGDTPERRGEQRLGAESGIAIQSRQFASQQSMAMPLDNLALSRRLLARRMLDLIQRFYDEPRVLRIAKTDAMTGKQAMERVEINTNDLNDLTIGEYDVVISDQPVAVTFQNDQFRQILEMLKLGVPIPPHRVIMASTLADKADIAQEISQGSAPSELDQAKELLARAQAVAKMVEGMFSSMRAAALLANNPALAGLADIILRSSGFKDQDEPPLVPTPSPGESAAGATPVPTNTNPLTPDNPERGARAGIESGAGGAS